MLEIDWITIPRGYFTYGLLANQPAERLHQPARKIFLDTFYISRYPITWLQFYEWAGSNHRWSIANIYGKDAAQLKLAKYKELRDKTPDHPATMPWHFALAFCEWLGAKLPTSMEWEKAARGTDGRIYPWGNDWDVTKGNFYIPAGKSSKGHYTTPVGQYPQGASPYGVMDMMGNALEYTTSTTVSHDGVNSSAEMIVCRGSTSAYTADQQDQLPQAHSVTHMFPQPINFGGYDKIGFRPVRTLWQKSALEKFD